MIKRCVRSVDCHESQELWNREGESNLASSPMGIRLNTYPMGSFIGVSRKGYDDASNGE